MEDKINCKYCGKALSNKALSHQLYCKENPNRKNLSGENNPMFGKKGSNQFASGEYVVSNETREKLSKISKGRKLTEEHKNILSQSAKKHGLGGVTQSRWIRYNDKTLGSSYELELVKDLDKNKIRWNTCPRFTYTDPLGKIRTYTPDIYLIDYDLYLDPKNDFLINNINPSLGFKDSMKIELVEIQNNIKVFILDKNQLTWNYVKTLIEKNKLII
jgi:hypothetical protein